MIMPFSTPRRAIPERIVRCLVMLALLAAFGTPLAACGKKAPLDPPPGSSEDNPYPRPYPIQ